MSIASKQSELTETSRKNGPLTDWLRGQISKPKTMAILASSAVAAISAAVCLPSSSVLSATQFSPSGDLLPAGATMSDDSDGFEIIPRGRNASSRSVSADRGTGSASPFGPPPASPAADPEAESVSVRRRAVLQAPVFSDQPREDSAPGARTIARELQPPPQSLEASYGHSGLVSRPVGYNYVAAAGINALPYAASAANSAAQDLVSTESGDPVVSEAATGGSGGAGSFTDSRRSASAASDDLRRPQHTGEAVPTTPITEIPMERPILQTPSRPVPPAPFEAPGFSSDVGLVQTGSPPAAPEMMQVFPQASGSEVPFERPPAQYDTDSQVIMPAPSSPAWGHSFGAPAPGTSGFRATVEADAQRWIDPYRNRTGLQPSGVEPTPTPVPSAVMPPGYSAWWDSLVQQRAGIAPRSMPVDVSSLVQQALQHSPQVQVLQADPEALRQVVKVEEAAFDWKAFLDAKYDDLNDPVGNTLTTGDNSRRFADNVVDSTGGLRRRTDAGGEFEVSQQLGHQYNNSIFLLPNPQSTSRLELSFRQPLLGRAGVVYNQNQIVLARISANLSDDETLQEIQSHLYRVAEVYWKLYRARAEFFQRQKLLASARSVLTTLDGRNEVDTIPRQILRARAAVARAESRMQRAVTDIRNAESELRLLVNDPAMLNSGPTEFTPTEMPATIPSPTGLRESLQEALVNRPDISQAIRQMRASGVRLGVSKNEMLPKLDFIVTSYVAGLQDRSQIADSVGNQFTEGRPGYTVGLEFEVPLGNRAARARTEQRQWELRRAISGFRATVETSLTEVEISCREVDTSWREMLGKYEAMVAAQNEVSYLQDRFDVLPAAEDSSILLLEDLLDGYERLADEESAFSQAQANYALSLILLRRTTGVLMRSRHDAPQLELDETDYLTSRVDQAASGAESRSSTALRTAGLTTVSPRNVSNSVPAVWSEPVGERPADEPSGITAPMPRRRLESAAHQTGQPLGGHSFGKEN